MTAPLADIKPPLAEVVAPLADRADIAARMKALYEQLDHNIAAQHPTCRNRGDCCKFGAFGHKLFVTAVELAYFLRGHRDDWRAPAGESACPYQIAGRCTAREHRPAGCRIFFCDANAQHWQGPLYEAFLAALKKAGDELDAPYAYVEWLSALASIPAPASQRPIGAIDPPSGPTVQLHVLAPPNPADDLGGTRLARKNGPARRKVGHSDWRSPAS